MFILTGKLKSNQKNGELLTQLTRCKTNFLRNDIRCLSVAIDLLGILVRSYFLTEPYNHIAQCVWHQPYRPFLSLYPSNALFHDPSLRTCIITIIQKANNIVMKITHKYSYNKILFSKRYIFLVNIFDVHQKYLSQLVYKIQILFIEGKIKKALE